MPKEYTWVKHCEQGGLGNPVNCFVPCEHKLPSSILGSAKEIFKNPMAHSARLTERATSLNPLAQACLVATLDTAVTFLFLTLWTRGTFQIHVFICLRNCFDTDRGDNLFCLVLWQEFNWYKKGTGFANSQRCTFCNKRKSTFCIYKVGKFYNGPPCGGLLFIEKQISL